MIARDRAGQLAQFLDSTITSREPDAEARTADGDEHRMWAVEAGRYEMRQLAPLLSESFYIADGHHRYETAVNYRNAIAAGRVLERDHPARFAMTAVVAASDPGLVIRPIHRIVPQPAPEDWAERLGRMFDVEHVKPIGDAADRAHELELLMAGQPGTIVALGLDGASVHALRLRDADALAASVPVGRSAAWAAIPPNVLRFGVLEPLWGITDEDLRAGAVEYDHDAAEVLARAEASADTVCFLLEPVGIDSVMSLADQGERMPQKSTFFHPKLGTGLVFYPLER